MPISAKLLQDIESNVITDEFVNLTPYSMEDVIYDDDAIKLAEALKKNKFIKKISLRCNGVKDKGIAAIAGVETLEELDISNGLAGYDDYYNDITYVGAEALAKSKLKKLVISSNPNLEDRGIIALSKSQTIVDLDVGGCGITAEGAKILFAVNDKIEKLSLADNSIGDEGLSSISSNHTIKELDLTACCITAHGMPFIAKNNCIIKLCLKDNKIGDGVNVLDSCKSLIYLNLMCCEISDDGVAALAKNKTLFHLNLYGNVISRDTLSSLAGYYSAYDNFTFTRTSEFIAQLLKKSIDVDSHVVGSMVTLPPSPPVISSPPTSNPVIFTPSHKRALPRSAQDQEGVEDSPPRKIAALLASTQQYQEFVHMATPEQMQEFYRALLILLVFSNLLYQDHR